MEDFPFLPVIGVVVVGVVLFFVPAWVWWLVGGLAFLYVVAWVLSEIDLFDIDVPFFFHFGGTGRRSSGHSRSSRKSKSPSRRDATYWDSHPR